MPDSSCLLSRRGTPYEALNETGLVSGSWHAPPPVPGSALIALCMPNPHLNRQTHTCDRSPPTRNGQSGPFQPAKPQVTTTGPRSCRAACSGVEQYRSTVFVPRGYVGWLVRYRLEGRPTAVGPDSVAPWCKQHGGPPTVAWSS